MSAKVIQFTFAAGEVSARVLMRGDIEAYTQAAKQLNNVFIDYRGGVVSRPGMEWIGLAPGRGRNVAFQLSGTDGGGLVLEFTDQRFRVVSEGSYVYETAKPVTAVAEATLTVPGHGWAVGDWLNVLGADYKIVSATADTVTVEDMWGAAPDLAGATEAARLFEQATPFTANVLQELRFSQNGRELVATHTSIPPHRIVFNGLTDWVVEEPPWAGSGSPPTGLSLYANAPGSTWYVYAVAAVIDGIETVPCAPRTVESAQMSQDEDAYIRVTWDAVPNADYYIIYRGREQNTEPTLGEELGFAGRAFATQFVDQNIAPDFKKTPLVHNNPFASRAIVKVNVTAPGGGYDYNTTVTISDPTGSGAAASATLTTVATGSPPVETKGIGTVRLQQGGSGYTAPTVTISGAGTGAIAEAVVGEEAVWPLCSARFQQRMVFAGSNAYPQRVFGSRPQDYYNFNYSIPTVDSDAYEHDLDATSVSQVKFMLPAVNGLLLFTTKTVFEMRGDATGRAITPLRVQASPEMSVGCSNVHPLEIDNDVIFQQARGTSVRSLAYNPVSNMYVVKDLTVLAPHLLRHYPIVSWVSAPEPHRLVIAARRDGRLLFFTYFPAQKIFGWTQGETCGRVLSLATVFEAGHNVTYALVERFINGRWVVFQEHFVDREWHSIFDVFAVDAGLRRTGVQHTATLKLTPQADGTVLIDTSVSLTPGDLIVADYGRFEVTSPTTGKVLAEPKQGWPCAGAYEVSQFTVFAQTTEIDGLGHLEGEQVQVFVDGDVQTPKTVVGGKITLDLPGWEVVVGLGYTCRIETLPIDTYNPAVQSRRRRHFRAALRVFESRGIYVGPSWDKLDEVKERDLGRLAETGDIQTRIVSLPVRGSWDKDATICVEQRFPLPLTVLGLVIDLAFGDDDEA